MTKDKRGIKRLCESCENKFYDLGRDPIICPSCETQFVPEKPKPKPKPRSKPKAAPAAPAAAPAPAPAPDKEKEKVEEAAEVSKTTEVVEPAASESEPPAPDPEFVSLEEAAAEEDVDEDAKLADLGDDEVEIPPDDNKDAFLVDDEDEGDSAVSGIIGGVGDTKDEG